MITNLPRPSVTLRFRWAQVKRTKLQIKQKNPHTPSGLTSHEIGPLSFYQIHVRDYLKLCDIWWDVLATNLGPETGYSELVFRHTSQ